MSFYTNVVTAGDKVLLREFDPELNRRVNRRVPFNPSLFVPADNPTGYKTIHDRPLKRLEFKGCKDYWNFRKRYSEMDMDFYGDINPAIQFISENYHGIVDYEFSKLRIFNIDIEVLDEGVFPNPEYAREKINSISLYSMNDNIMHIWSLAHEDSNGWDQNVRYADSDYAFDWREFDNEYDLLMDFLCFWKSDFPDIVTGWYIEGFDIPYIVNRIENVLGENESKKLSPWKSIREKPVRGQSYETTPNILGISILDYLVQYKKYSFTPQESYSLDHVAHAEIGEKKLSYDDVSGLRELYFTDYQKFIDYNIRDVDLVQRIEEEKRGFLKLIVSIAYYAKINFDNVISPIRTWDSLIYNMLKEQGIQIPRDKASAKTGKFKGAYVKIPEPGRYNWVASVDLASEYPSLMRGLNISPDRFRPDIAPVQQCSIEDLLEKKPDLSGLESCGVAMASNNTFYEKDKEGFLPVLLTTLFKERKEFKRQMLDFENKAERAEGSEKEQYKRQKSLMNVQQLCRKILLNSVYGALGNKYFRFFDVRMAEAVTYSGELAIKWAEKAINEYLNDVLKTDSVDYIIAIDTDSLYINVGEVVKKFLPDETDLDKIVDKLDVFFKKKVLPVIADAYDDLYQYMNHREQLMFMDREVIASRAVWASKKHYCLRVHDSEGVRYAQPKVKISGLVFIKSDVPGFCGEYCEKVMVPIALDGDNEEFSQAIADFEKVFREKPVEDIAKVTGVSNIDKYMEGAGSYIKGTPIGSKASIIYNHLHKKHELGTSYPTINEGDKIKYVYLKKINPIGEKVIGFVDYLPDEFKLDEFIDWDLMFEKSFIGPVSELLRALGWSRVVMSSLDEWFE